MKNLFSADVKGKTLYIIANDVKEASEKLEKVVDLKEVEVIQFKAYDAINTKNIKDKHDILLPDSDYGLENKVDIFHEDEDKKEAERILTDEWKIDLNTTGQLKISNASSYVNYTNNLNKLFEDEPFDLTKGSNTEQERKDFDKIANCLFENLCSVVKTDEEIKYDQVVENQEKEYEYIISLISQINSLLILKKNILTVYDRIPYLKSLDDFYKQLGTHNVIKAVQKGYNTLNLKDIERYLLKQEPLERDISLLTKGTPKQTKEADCNIEFDLFKIEKDFPDKFKEIKDYITNTLNSAI